MNFPNSANCITASANIIFASLASLAPTRVLSDLINVAVRIVSSKSCFESINHRYKLSYLQFNRPT